MQCVQCTQLISITISPIVYWGKGGVQYQTPHCALCECSALTVLQERDKVMPLIIQGFKDASEEAGTSVTGGQTVLNPWVVMGGVATTVCQPNEFIM